MNRKTALITGAARRIGAAIARYLHVQDIDVVIHYNHSADAARSLARELCAGRADSALAVQADLHDCNCAAQLVQASLQLGGRLDVLVNNASSFYPTLIGDISEPAWQDIIDTNMKAPLFLSQAAAPYLRKTTGCIINITDIHGRRPLKGHPVYSAAKAGLIMLTRALAKELAPEIRVNAVSPGAVLWPEGMTEEIQQTILDRIPLARQGRTTDIAAAVYFLVENAAYITGQVIEVDGGRSLTG